MASIQGDDSKAENSFSIFVSATVEYEMKRSRPILINEYVINDKFYQVKKTNRCKTLCGILHHCSFFL